MKKKLYIPLIAITLSTGLLAIYSNNVDAAAAAPVKNTAKTNAVAVTPAASMTVTPAAQTQIQLSVSGNAVPSNMISEAEAKKIAFEHAGIKEADASHLTVKLDYDDKVFEYEVEFYVGTKEYDYDINATTGVIQSFDYDIEEDHASVSNNSISGNNAGSKGISEAEARKIALAKVPGATNSDIRRVEADIDNGRLVYEGKILFNGREYEFEIDAATGTVKDWSVETDDRDDRYDDDRYDDDDDDDRYDDDDDD